MASYDKSFWNNVVEALHLTLTAIIARSRYPEGHPAFDRIDEAAVKGFSRVLEQAPEVMIGVIEGEFVISERPLPELRDRLPGLLDALEEHGLECLIFTRGFDRGDLAALAGQLASAPDKEHAEAARERLQLKLKHVLVRWVVLKQRGLEQEAEIVVGPCYEAPVAAMLAEITPVVIAGDVVDQESVRFVARTLYEAVKRRNYAIPARGVQRGVVDLVPHVTNVALMSAAMALEAAIDEAAIVEITCAALVHDVGYLVLPEEIRGVPDPLLDERQRAIAREHAFAGARALFDGGCPALWVATALDHHRGVDGQGYPRGASAPPHDATRIVSVANYLDRKRARLDDTSDAHELAVRDLAALSGRYFERRWIDAALRAIGVYPPGTDVDLTDGRKATVVRANPREPLRPVVRLRDPRAGESPNVDLSRFQIIERRYDVSIARALIPRLG